MNLTQLEKDIQLGKVSDIEIISHNELLNYLTNRMENYKVEYLNSVNMKNKIKFNRSVIDLLNVKRDGECLIKGCVPSKYINLEEK